MPGHYNKNNSMLDFVAKVGATAADIKQKNVDNKYRQDVLNLKVSEALRAQSNLDRAYDYQTGGEVIDDPEIASFLGVEKGTQIPRSQLNMFFQKGVTDYKKDMATEKIKITPTIAAMIGNEKLAGSEVSREMLPLVNAVQNYYTQSKFYEDTAEKESEKRQAITRDAMLKTPVTVPLFDTSELDDPININEGDVRTSANSLLGYLTIPNQNQITPLQALTAKAEEDPQNSQVNNTILQLENVVKTMNMPGMRTGNIIPSVFGDRTQSDKNRISNTALESLKQLYKAKKMNDDDILKKIKVLKAKQPENVSLPNSYQ